ncbi:MAG: dimethylarginine dimethylaminohydrolase family protein [Candidatus Hodarchaeota archaeon]
MTYKYALVRKPGAKFSCCISSHPQRNTISLTLAYKQHENYCRVLTDLGLEIIHLPQDDDYPDSCFVEDNAVIYNGKGFITRMGVESRQGEEIAVERILSDYMETKRASHPATIEGGDIIHVLDRLISGVTQRTNKEGIYQMENWFGVKVDRIEDPNIIHLKSYVTYLGNNIMLTTKTYLNHPVLRNFLLLITPDKESYAANTLTIGDTVLLPNDYPRTQAMVREAGFEVITLDISEFQKCEGALTCLSLLF